MSLLLLVGACEAPGGEDNEDASSTEASSSTTSSSASAGSADTSDSADGSCDTTLLDHDAWTTLEAEADPLADHRPETVECSIAGWYVEDEKLEIDTFFCNYLALTQPLLEDVVAGDTLEIGLYHFDLLAPEPAVAHVAILIDDAVVWERDIEIPGGQTAGPAQVFDETFTSPVSASAGAPLMIHLHNHGQNTWTFVKLNRCSD